MALFTCSYREFERLQAPERLPVRTTVGAPYRRPPSYSDLLVYCKEVTPLKRFVFPNPLPYEEYEREYRTMLAGHGPEGIDRAFSRLRQMHDRPDLVLLCFDDLAKPDMWCHRTMFAQWWMEQTGEEVVELGRHFVAPTGGTAEDATLFDDIQSGA